MLRKLSPYLFIGLLAITSCNSKPTNQQTAGNDGTDNLADTTMTEQAADSTIYGTSSEDFGMSTFSLVTDKGDTLQLCRTANDGTNAQIYGSVTYRERYALTTRDNGESLGVLINLTELEQKVKDYEIRNGWLIVKGDTVSPSKYLN